MATGCVGIITSTNDSIGGGVLTTHHFFQQEYLPIMITELTDNGALVSLLFGQKQSIEWKQFKQVASFHLKAKDMDLENLKPVLGAELGALDRTHFSKFLRWFSPLMPEAESGNARSPSSVWTISTVAKLISQPWFHGFTLDTSRRLKNSSEGTFLIRFGCQAPHFVLALKDKATGSVMEWRVLATNGSVRLQDGERFEDLHSFVNNYAATVPSGASCPLAYACI